MPALWCVNMVVNLHWYSQTFLVVWLVLHILAAEDDLRMMIVGFSLSGLSTGIFLVVRTVYITKTCASHERNIITAIACSCSSFGVLLSHFLGMVLFWRVAIGCSIFIPGIALMLAFFSIETPTWFLLKGRIDKAENNFIKVRGTSEEAAIELKVLLERQTVNKIWEQ